MDETRDNSQGSGAQGDDLHPSMRLVPIDHDEYDALADLFLGGGELAPEPFEDAGRVQRGPDHSTHTPVLQLTSTDDDLAADDDRALEELDGSAGAMESLEATGQHASALMAELMLEDDPASADAGALSQDDLELVRLPVPRIEMVVLGHLPVRATLWARQYACSSAKERDEVVALVRAASGTTAIDLITGREPIGVEGSSDLEGALRTIHADADRVILRVDERNEPDLLDRPEVDTITVLTGADEAAVVASYRLIKTIDASLGERYEDDDDAPLLRIAVMGAGREQGLDARAKLQRAVDSFIARPVEIVVGAGRIDATGTTNIFRDTRAYSGGRVIDSLVALAHPEDSLDAPAGLDLVETRGVDLGDVRGKPVERAAVKNAAPAAAKPAVSSDRSDAARGRASEHSPVLRDGLCALIEGVRPIETRCPKAPGVEMGTDDEGLLHLLVCDADCDGALERLYTAQNWARDHLGLLLRAEPGLRFPSSDSRAETDAVMHLISHEPSALRSIYDTPVRMYALARVRVGGVIAQVATALN